MISARRLSTILLGGWGFVVLASLLVVAFELGPRALVAAPAHESEARSLLRTMLYPAHALRELPHLVLLALVWLAAVARPRDWRELGGRLGALALLTGGACALLFAAAAAEVGPAAAWQSLVQARAASDLEGTGVHFRFHLPSDLVLGGLLYAAGRSVGSGDDSGESRVRLWAAGLAGGLFAVALAIWGVESVTTPRFVGHAGREIETFALVVLPVLWAVALRRPGARFEPRRALAEPGVRLALAIAAFVTGALGWLALGVDLRAASSAPGRDPALNLSAHHFEHAIDLAFLLGAGLLARRGVRSLR